VFRFEICVGSIVWFNLACGKLCNVVAELPSHVHDTAQAVSLLKRHCASPTCFAMMVSIDKITRGRRKERRRRKASLTSIHCQPFAACGSRRFVETGHIHKSETGSPECVRIRLTAVLAIRKSLIPPAEVRFVVQQNECVAGIVHRPDGLDAQDPERNAGSPKRMHRDVIVGSRYLPCRAVSFSVSGCLSSGT